MMHVLLHSLSLAIAFATFTGLALAQQDRSYSYARVSLRQTNVVDGVEQHHHKCAGSLVAPDMVLTAGSCKGHFDVIDIGVDGTGTSGSESFEAVYERRHFSHQHLHPLFEVISETEDEDVTARYYNDVMLIKLNATFTMGDPVRVNNISSVPLNDTELTVLDVGQGNDLHGSVQEISVQFQNNSECGAVADDLNLSLEDFLEYGVMCASSASDACSLDSGSPLILKGENEQDDRLVGIVGWDYDCTGALPVVYSRLGKDNINRFIEEIVCYHSEEAPSYMSCD